MSKTVHGAACWECLDFNIKNTMGEECEGNKHIFCDKSLAEHDKQIRAEMVEKFNDKVNYLKGSYADACNMCTKMECDVCAISNFIEDLEQLKEQDNKLYLCPGGYDKRTMSCDECEIPFCDYR